MNSSPPVPEFDPEWVHESNATRIVGVVGFFHFTALIFVALRVYVRAGMVKSFGVDDGLIIAAGALALGSWICLVLQVPHGLGRHGLIVPTEDRIKLEHIGFWKTVISDGVAMGLLRISMALSLLRLKKDLKWYKISLFAVIVFVVLYSIQAIVWLFVYCTPYSGWWEFQWKNPFDPRCRDFNVFINLTYWNISCNIFTDVCLGALPVPIIWHLKMKLRVRLYVIAILNLGYFAVLMGILKAVFMLTTGGSPDSIFHLWVHFWQNLQLNFGLIAASAGFLKPLLGRVLKLNSTAADYYQSNRYGRSGRTPIGVATIGSHRGHAGIPDGNVDDEFEMHAKNDAHTSPPVTTRVEAYQPETGSSGGRRPSESNSEELILQKPESAQGIMCRRDFSVEYKSK